MANIFREVDEELRKERYASLFKKYGAYVIGFIVIVVSLLISIQIYQSYKISSNTKILENYINVIEMKNESIDEKILLLDDFSETSNIFINGLSLLKKADLMIEKNDKISAIKILREIIDNNNIENIHRDLGLYKFLLLSLNQISYEDFDKYSSKLNKKSQFYHLIKELEAIKLLLDGNYQDATNKLTILKNNTEVAIDIKNRVEILIEIAD